MKTHVFIFITMLCGMLLTAPALAAIYEPTWKGSVIAVNPEKATVSVEITGTYGCDYIEEDVNCTFDEVDPKQVTAEIQDISVYDIVEIGDSIIGKSLGDLESTTWSAFAILTEGDMYIEALFGDPSVLDIVPLAADYAVSYTEMVADCEACTGTVCPATSVLVSILSEETEVVSETIAPGEAISYFGRADGSGVAITFVSGETSYMKCETDTTEPMTGPQAIQDFSIIVTLPSQVIETEPFPLNEASEEATSDDDTAV